MEIEYFSMLIQENIYSESAFLAISNIFTIGINSGDQHIYICNLEYIFFNL